MKTNAQLTFDSLRFDAPTDLHLVLSLQAPTIAWQSRRPPICVVPVVDVSGSMAGDKLRYAKASVGKLIDHLVPGDFFGLLTFSNDVTVISPPVEITLAKKAALKKAVAELQSDASTNFAGGMLEALRLVNEGAIPSGMIRRVIMFTDGLANVGVATASADIVRLLEANLGTATVSAFGYGSDADQELLRDVSTSGKGNYAFVRSPEDALTAFARELGGLLSTYARELELVVRPGPVTKLADVVSDVDAREEGDTVRIRIPELLSEELRQVVVALKAGPRVEPGVAQVAVVEGTFQQVDDRGQFRRETFRCEVEVRFVLPGEQQTAPTPAVDEVVAMAEVLRAQIAAEEAAKRGEFEASQKGLSVLVTSLKGRGQLVAAEACASVLASVQDRAAYDASASYRTSLRKGLSRSAVGTLDPAAAALIGKTGRKLSNHAQDVLSEAFAEPPQAAPEPAPTRARKPRKASLNRKKSKGSW